MTRRQFDLLLAAASGVLLAYLLLPMIGLFTRTSPVHLWEAMGSEPARLALVVSLKTSLVAHVFILLVGTPMAYALATKSFKGRRVAVALVEVPLVLPPAVAGIGLLAAFGRRGLFGQMFADLGLPPIALTQTAVVLAVVFVASPLYIRQAIASFEAIDRDVLDAARTLGSAPFRTFVRIAIPLASSGLGAGSVLAFGRGLGEFGATIMFAGNFPGVTQTLPLAIYSELDRNFEIALAIGGLLLIVSATLLIAVKVIPSWRTSSSIVASRFEASISS